MNATIAAIVAANTAQSSADQQESTEAKKIACGGFMRGYQDATATVLDKKQYASCVNIVHPSELSEGDVIAFKIMILLALIGVVWGGYKGHQERDGIVITIMFALGGMICVPIVIGAFIALIWGVTYLF